METKWVKQKEGREIGGQVLFIVLFGMLSNISQYINQNSKENRMKALLGMAKQRRKQQPNQPKPLSKLNLSKQKAPEPPSEQQQYNDNFEEEQYDPDEQQILGYADYIGIKLPEEEDLLYIAREGLMADMPPGWEEQETEDGNVYYVNNKTGQALAEHPCDEHYRQLVIKQRRKRAGGAKSGVGSLFPGPQKINLQTSKQVKKDIDPLVKLQQQKKKKKQAQQKRKQYQDKKKQTEQKYNRKKQELQNQYKKKQNKIKQKYDEQIKNEKKKKQKKMSQQQKQNEQKTKKQMQKYQRQLRAKLEKKYHDRRMMEKEKIDGQMKVKRQEIRKQFELQIKQKKKQLQQQNKQKLKILLQKQQKLIPTHSQADLFQQQLAEIKKQIIAKQLKNYEQKIQKQRSVEEDNFRAKMGQIQRMFEEEVRKLEGMGGQGQRQLAFDGVYLQVQAAQKRQLQALQYQIKMQRQLKKAQLQLQLQTHRTKIQASQNQDLLRLQNSFEHTLQKLHNLKQQQQQTKLSERQKKLRQSYLSSLQELHKKYLQEEQMIILQSSSSSDIHQQNDMHTLSVCQQVLERLSVREENLRREVVAIRGEIGKIGDGYKPIRYKLEDQQLRMYELIRANILGSGAQTTQNEEQQ